MRTEFKHTFNMEEEVCQAGVLTGEQMDMLCRVEGFDAVELTIAGEVDSEGFIEDKPDSKEIIAQVRKFPRCGVKMDYHALSRVIKVMANAYYKYCQEEGFARAMADYHSTIMSWAEDRGADDEM